MSPIIEGGMEYKNAGVPGAGTSEVQTLTIGGTPEGGSFKLGYEGQISGAIAWSATNATLLASINAALDALATVGAGGIVATAGTLTDGIGTVTLTFGANLAKQVVPLVSVAANSLTGTDPTLAVEETTPGVTASFRGAPKGAMVTDTTNGKLYINTGTALVPIWTVVGTQT